MSQFWLGFSVGIFVGCNVGVIVIGLLAASKCGECGSRIEHWLEEKTR